MRRTTDTITTVSADVAPGLRLEVDVYLWAARRGDQWVAKWSLVPDPDHEHVRFAGRDEITFAALALGQDAHDWYHRIPDRAPVALAIDAAAHEAAERALIDWLAQASAIEGGILSHDRAPDAA